MGTMKNRIPILFAAFALNKLFLLSGLTYMPGIAQVQEAAADFPVCKCPYLGQKPPGENPVVFAPGIISTEMEEFGCTFTPDGTEFYFTRVVENPQKQQKRMTILISRLGDSGWQKPIRAPFCKEDGIYGEPNFSPDGMMVLYGCLVKSENGSQDERVFMAERKGKGWSEPIDLMHGMFASVTDDGMIYYTDVSNGHSKGDIYRVRYDHGGLHSPEKLSGKINTPQQDAHPFITSPGDLLIFDSNRPGGYGDNDLYICFRKDDGSWCDPLNMGPRVNTQAYDAIPYLTPDGQYLFFFRNNNIYWVSSVIIEELKTIY